MRTDDFATKLAEFQARAGLSSEEMAKIFGVKVRQYHHLRAGRRKLTGGALQLLRLLDAMPDVDRDYAIDYLQRD